MVTKSPRHNSGEIYDNDQLDYLWKVHNGETNFVEDWAEDRRLVVWWEGKLVLTTKGQLVISLDYERHGRQIIEAYPQPAAKVTPPVDPGKILPEDPSVAETPPVDE
jgi:hypothetical protein